MHEPTKDPNVPYNVIPPDNPCGTDLKEVIDTGLDLESFPNSVAHVSDITVATEAAYKY